MPYSMAMRFFCGSFLCGALGIEMRKIPSSNLADMILCLYLIAHIEAAAASRRCTAPGGYSGLFHPVSFLSRPLAAAMVSVPFSQLHLHLLFLEAWQIDVQFIVCPSVSRTSVFIDVLGVLAVQRIMDQTQTSF